MRLNKMKSISALLNHPFDDIIKGLYLNKTLASQEISDELFRKTKILITSRSIQRRLKQMGIIRSFSQAFNLSIKKGRKSYEHLRKTVKSSSLRKGIAPKLRFQVFHRDGYRCVLCGKTAQDDLLVIDHIKPVAGGGTNDEKNLRTLCRECNSGKGKVLLEPV
ncbi:MAG: HNH endonuclease signature motif containing protein [Patescibacteria group bacterium]|nr:HNH endonuclease signature motif containing protein [Patescibacteria group bacterium]